MQLNTTADKNVVATEIRAKEPKGSIEESRLGLSGNIYVKPIAFMDVESKDLAHTWWLSQNGQSNQMSALRKVLLLLVGNILCG